MAFRYKTENHAFLTPTQESLLDTIENLFALFDGIRKLKDLRSKTNVSVIISNKQSLITVCKISIFDLFLTATIIVKRVLSIYTALRRQKENVPTKPFVPTLSHCLP